MSYGRTAEHRVLRAKLIHVWKPWLKSTGPRTETGKYNSANRSYKGAVRPKLRAVAKTLRAQQEVLDGVINEE